MFITTYVLFLLLLFGDTLKDNIINKHFRKLIVYQNNKRIKVYSNPIIKHF